MADIRTEITTRRLIDIIGHTTLVGFYTETWPAEHGNCCAIANMYTENAQEVARRYPDIAESCKVIEVYQERPEYFERYFIVIDERLPKEWLINTCNSCNHGWVDVLKRVAEELKVD